MDRNELCHLWSVQSRPRRKAGSISFDGPTLYSYSTAIAHIHSRKLRAEDRHTPERFVLMTDRYYSMTTAAQKSAARRAVSHLPLAEVPHIQPRSAREHGENLDFLNARMQEAARKAGRRTTEQGVQWDAERAADFHKAMADYAIFFRVRRKMPAMPGFAAAFERARRIENPDPASADKRERARAQRAVAKAERERKAEHARKLAHMCARSNWRLGNPFGIPDYSAAGYGQPVMLRLEGEQIVTSMGARIPAAAAPMVWNLVERARKLGAPFDKSWCRVYKVVRIGDYPLDRIDADGTLHAGCHTIPYSELASMARQLGLA